MEISYFGGNTAGESAGVEHGYFVNPRLARDEGVPEGVFSDAVGGYDAESGDDYTTGFSHGASLKASKGETARTYHKCGKILRDCSPGALLYNCSQPWRSASRAERFWRPPCLSCSFPGPSRRPCPEPPSPRALLSMWASSST